MFPYIKRIKSYLQLRIENICKKNLARKVTNKRTEMVYKARPAVIN